MASRPGSSPWRRARRVAPVAVAVVAALTSACGGPGGRAASSPGPAADAMSATAASSPTRAPSTSRAPSTTRAPSTSAAASPIAAPPSRRRPPASTPRVRRPLAGRTVVLDPGHQIGNAGHRSRVDRLVDAGHGVRKPCNSTGTQTNGGYPESRVTMRVALAARARLEALGARVVLTRPREDRALWGPCVDRRGRTGNGVRADAVVSVHADGAPAGDRGFHVIRPASVRGWTDDVAGPSRRLAVAVHDALRSAGVRPARYIGSRDGYDVRSDLGTLNWSERPVVMVELGNMRDAADAALLTDPGWQDGVAAAAIADGVVAFLGG